ncbi:peptidase domain-containing ABC transporter [Desulfuribacillus alkaliarsenatis]|uniref:Bacteriocin ABC transporter ATP-binding protein n=1 Tax=Desulfuribacillus alkaliarsenatis TaxID=766136 RepID=A0A1E5G4L4_9FIRM|nr:peptidase domain-containing ABC transporter [Desulfuribacillus alkaliarsenatis]OEF98118.1 bacteriocin ABC transporter ATP-binding protein [Desulfuribacillus alkaliarsenatis]
MLRNPFQKYTCIKQHDEKDCGAACLATIAKQYGLKIPISKIREIAGTDKQGTNAYGLITAAEKLGFSAKGVKGNQEALFEEFPLPAIAHVVIDQKLLHYVVIHKISKKEIIIADPAKGIVKLTPEEFFQIWTGVLILMVPTAQFQRGDETKGLFSRFFGIILPHKKLILHVMLASILITIFGIAGSFYFQFLIDEILPYNLNKTLHIISIGLIVMYIFQTMLSAFRTHLLLYISQKLSITIMLGYYRHVLKLPIKFFGTRKVGEIISRFMDANKVTEAISSAALTVILDVTMILLVGGILYYQNATLFFVTLLLVPFYALVVWIFVKPYEKINRTEMEDNAQLTANIVESINGIETVKAYNAERKVNDETEKRFVKYLKTVFKHGVIDNVQSSLKMFLQLVGGTMILWVGSYQVLNGHLSAGQLITFNALLAYFLEPLQRLINLQPTLQSATVASDRLGEILDIEAEKSDNEDKKINPESLRGDIKIKNIDFRYGTRQLVLKNINMHINKGEKIALVGESGSGKTTLVKLLVNFYQAEKGEILIDDNNILDINRDVLRSKTAYIPQDTFFFSGTIRENLSLGMMEEVGMEKLVEAAKLAKAHDFINNLPLRYNTILEENATNLSGGQKQRLAIARAILKQPDILIMDEATSNLDSTTEKAISDTIQNLTQGITTIIIAHRLSTIMRCDKIYVMEHGEIIELGTHTELMKDKGKYYELWKDQLPSIPDDKGENDA